MQCMTNTFIRFVFTTGKKRVVIECRYRDYRPFGITFIQEYLIPHTSIPLKEDSLINLQNRDRMNKTYTLSALYDCIMLGNSYFLFDFFGFFLQKPICGIVIIVFKRTLIGVNY